MFFKLRKETEISKMLFFQIILLILFLSVVGVGILILAFFFFIRCKELFDYVIPVILTIVGSFFLFCSYYATFVLGYGNPTYVSDLDKQAIYRVLGFTVIDNEHCLVVLANGKRKTICVETCCKPPAETEFVRLGPDEKDIGPQFVPA